MEIEGPDPTEEADPEPLMAAASNSPREVAEKGYGYLEDRRPSSNCDPYSVSESLVFLRLIILWDHSWCGFLKLRDIASKPFTS